MSTRTDDLVEIQQLLAKYAVIDPEAEQVIATMQHIPIDIRPIYPERI